MRNERFTDFDIGVGWHSERSCGSWSGWAFSCVTHEAVGELTLNHFKIAQLTILGFYFRVCTKECVTGDYMERATDLLADMEKEKIMQTINRAIESFSREQIPLFIYEVLEQSRLHAESQEAQREWWHGRKPN